MDSATQTFGPARLLALGDGALTLELGRTIAPETHERVLGVAAALEALQGTPALTGVEEWVSSFCALTVYFNPDTTDAQALGQVLLDRAAKGTRASIAGFNWTLPACFDEDFAPDLVPLAERKGLSVAQVIEILTSASFRVYTIGFLPGFPYLGGLPEALQVPRLSSPRSAVPAQSIAVAGAMCAVYPWLSPGGWHLLGRTPVPMFDPRHAERPALLAPGDRLRWQIVDRATYDAMAAQAEAGTLDLAALRSENP